MKCSKRVVKDTCLTLQLLLDSDFSSIPREGGNTRTRYPQTIRIYRSFIFSLQIYATPPPVEYGFVKRPVSVFPPCNEQQYLSPVRLVISPRCKPQSRTAWSQRYRYRSHKVLPAIQEIWETVVRDRFAFRGTFGMGNSLKFCI